jgi:hypothetical protein
VTWIDRLFVWVLFLGTVVSCVFTASYANDTRDAALLLAQQQRSPAAPVYEQLAVVAPEPEVVEVVTERIVPVIMTPMAIATQGVNVRETPGNDGAIVGWLEQDDQVAVLEIGDGWWRIEGGDDAGWVFADYLTLVAIEEPE